MGWMTGVQFPEGSMMGSFLFVNAPKPTLGPSQPPVQWAPGLLPRVKWLEREADHSPSFSTKAKNTWLYTSTSPICLHGMVLS